MVIRTHTRGCPVNGRFIVSTGRCGSTLLSQLLREHPAVLSLSEFFAFLHSPSFRAFPGHPMTGAEFWEVLSTPRPEIVSVVRQCRAPIAPELLQSQFGTPPVMMGALPFLTENPEPLFDELRCYVRGLPRADCGQQYSLVFAWLCQRFGRDVWVERSGGSTWFLADLLRWWPGGRFVHLVRDGRDVALSMSRRRGFRLAVLVDDMEQASSPEPSASQLAAAALAMTGSEPIPLERFGRIWAQQVIGTEERLRPLPADQVFQLRYEDLVEDPARQLKVLSEFFDLGDVPEEWMRWSAREVERRESAWLQLPEADRAELEAACEPGLRHLGYL
jgi:hypothetical protein